MCIEREKVDFKSREVNCLKECALALIELFCVALFVLSLCPFDISVGVGAFVIGLGQISPFLSPYKKRPFPHNIAYKLKVASTSGLLGLYSFVKYF